MKHQSTFSNIIKVFLILAGVLLTPIDSRSQSSPTHLETNKIIVIGFVGGLRSPEDINQGVVQIRNRLRNINCARATGRYLQPFSLGKAVYEYYSDNRP